MVGIQVMVEIILHSFILQKIKGNHVKTKQAKTQKCAQVGTGQWDLKIVHILKFNFDYKF